MSNMGVSAGRRGKGLSVSWLTLGVSGQRQNCRTSFTRMRPMKSVGSFSLQGDQHETQERHQITGFSMNHRTSRDHRRESWDQQGSQA